jgi:hypothetical protein
MKERIKGAIIIISCNKHKDTRLKKYRLPKSEYRGYKVFYILGNPKISSEYELRENNIITLRCEDSYIHILKKVILAIKTITNIYDIEEGILRCGDDLLFEVNNLNKFLDSVKTEDYMGNIDGYGKQLGIGIIKKEDIGHRIDYFMPEYFISNPEDLINPLNGIEYNLDVMRMLYVVPNCRYINGVVTWLSIKSCELLKNELEDRNWNTFQYNPRYGYPYIIEDVGIGFILSKSDIYPVDRKFYTDINFIDFSSDETIAIHTNDYK